MIIRTTLAGLAAATLSIAGCASAAIGIATQAGPAVGPGSAAEAVRGTPRFGWMR